VKDYKPRRCGKRWLDGDCPKGVLAIMDHPKELDRYTIFYNAPIVDDGRGSWLTYLSSTEDGWYYHDEMEAYKVANYRYHNAHRYIRWSDLPEVVKNIVRKDLENA